MFRMMLSLHDMHNGALNGIKAMPQKDSTSDGHSTFAMGRQRFVNTYSTDIPTNQQYTQKKWIGGNRDASQVAVNRKNTQIGTGSVNASGDLMSFTTYKDINTVNNALTRVRAGGYMVPPKVRANKNNAPTPSFSPVGIKSHYGIKIPTLYH
jgi:hypothetical protein